jgi:hypothetical protein
MANLFESAANDPQFILEVVQAMQDAGSHSGVTLSEDPLRFVKTLFADEKCVLSLRARLSEIAATHGLDFMPETPIELNHREALLEALWNAAKDRPPVTVTSMPIVFLFVAAALIFAPSVFRSVGGTLFGDDTIQSVEGVEPFG